MANNALYSFSLDELTPLDMMLMHFRESRHEFLAHMFQVRVTPSEIFQGVAVRKSLCTFFIP